jgi:tetratricopeptide (TPR) repeat protein
MPGRVIDALLPPEAAARPVARVRSLEPERRPVPRPADAADPALRERLVTLGYVGASSTSLGRLNLGEILYRRGDYAGAERELRAALGIDPAHLVALERLYDLLRASGRAREALGALERYVLRDLGGEAAQGRRRKAGGQP